MRELLRTGDQVCPPEQDIRYTILEPAGSGSSCIAYRAECFDGRGGHETHLLKEYAPSRFPVYRAPDGVMRPADELRDAYQAGMDRFLAGARNTISLRRQRGFQDIICEILRMFPANGTWYLDMPLSEGIVYAGVQEFSLDNLFQRMGALIQAVGRIHQAGFLCLDLKPGNLLVRLEEPAYVMLFDLDTAIRKQDLSQGAKLYYSQAWAPPEQKLPSLYGEICEATDLYAIGELLFCQLFGRHSRPDERRPCAVFDFKDAPLLAGADPEMIRALDGVLRKAISTSPKSRYRRAGELLEALGELSSLLGREAPSCGAPALPCVRESVANRASPGSRRGHSLLDLTCVAIESGNYEPVRRASHLCRIRAEALCGRNSLEYLNAMLYEAATCFSELAPSWEEGATPPPLLTGEFLQILVEYLTVAEALPSKEQSHRGSLAAFADGLRQTISQRLAQCRNGNGLPDGDRTLLDMAMALARHTEDAEALAEFREMSRLIHKA